MADNTITFDIAERIAVLKRWDTGWALECNLVSWNNGPYKIDLREAEQVLLWKEAIRYSGIETTDRCCKFFPLYY